MKKNYINTLFVLKKDQFLRIGNGDLKFKSGDEFHIVNNVLYMEGCLFYPQLQSGVINWIESNPELFTLSDKNY